MKGLNSTGSSSTGVTGAIGLTRGVIDNGYSTAIYHGDPVVIHTDGYVILCAETAQATHILRGVEYINADGQYTHKNHFPASTSNTGKVDGETDVVAILEPVADHLFLAETADAAFAQTHVGQQFRLKDVGSEVGSTGKSAAAVDLDASVTSEVRLVEVVNIERIPGNEIGDTGATAIVKFV